MFVGSTVGRHSLKRLMADEATHGYIVGGKFERAFDKDYMDITKRSLPAEKFQNKGDRQRKPRTGQQQGCDAAGI